MLFLKPSANPRPLNELEKRVVFFNQTRLIRELAATLTAAFWCFVERGLTPSSLLMLRILPQTQWLGVPAVASGRDSLPHGEPAGHTSGRGGYVVCNGCNGTTMFDNVFELNPDRHTGIVCARLLEAGCLIPSGFGSESSTAAAVFKHASL